MGSLLTGRMVTALCLASPETMKRKLEELKQEKEATTGLKCEVDEETNEVSCIGQTKGNIYLAQHQEATIIVDM